MRGSPLIPCLTFEDCCKVRNRIRCVVERTPLVHADFSNTAVSGQNDVKISVGIVKQLDLIEQISAVKTISQINLCEITVIRALFFIIKDLILFFLLDSNI